MIRGSYAVRAVRVGAAAKPPVGSVLTLTKDVFRQTIVRPYTK